MVQQRAKQTKKNERKKFTRRENLTALNKYNGSSGEKNSWTRRDEENEK